MWQYRCPICGKVNKEENMGKKEVMRLVTHSHKCPACEGRLYVTNSGSCVDLGLMLARALEIGTGIVLSKEEMLSHYYDI